MKNKRRENKIKKFLTNSIIIFGVFFFVFTIFGKTQISAKNIEVERLKRQVVKQEKINESLSMKVNELISRENMQHVANDKGLAYINNNIIVIQK